MTDTLTVLGLLVAGHALADYPLQGEFLARAKNRLAPVDGVPFYQALGAHAAIHGGIVGVVTGSFLLGLAEAAAHALIDDSKCAGRLSYNQDQAAHLLCKVAWCGILAALGPVT
jgi:hypothetical protein